MGLLPVHLTNLTDPSYSPKGSKDLNNEHLVQTMSI